MSEENKKNTLSVGEFPKDKVLSKLKENLENHDKFYQDSCETYWQLAEQKLKNLEEDYFKGYRKLKKDVNKTIKENLFKIEEKIDFSYYLPNTVVYSKIDLPNKPKSYSDAYKKTIEWLSLSTDETIVLNSKEFDQFIMDKWDFKAEIKSNFNTMMSGCGSVTGFFPVYHHTGAESYINKF